MERQTAGGQDPLEQALMALRDGNYGLAGRICDRLLAANRQDPAVQQLAAAIALHERRLDDAERLVCACLALRPGHAPALTLAGRIARSAGNSKLALTRVRNAQALAPDLAEPAFQLCVLLLEQHDPEARVMLDQLLRQFPNEAEGWREIGVTLHTAKQPEAAVVAFARAASSSQGAGHQRRLGAVLQELGRPDEAVAAFGLGVAREPDHLEGRLALAACLRQIGNLQAARVEFEKATHVHAGDGRAWFGLGLVCDDLCDAQGAMAAYRRCLELRPGTPEAHVNLGLNLQHDGDLGGAIASYKNAVRLRPHTFGRIAQSLCSAKAGQLWLDLGKLRRSLTA